MIPAFGVHQDIASSCATTLIRGLDLLVLGVDAPENLARIVNESYRFLPYALDFWIEHCFCSAETAADLGQVISNRLILLYNKHIQCYQKQAGNLDERNIAMTGIEDNGPDMFIHTPIHGVMKEVLETRSLTRECGLDSG